MLHATIQANYIAATHCLNNDGLWLPKFYDKCNNKKNGNNG